MDQEGSSLTKSIFGPVFEMEEVEEEEEGEFEDTGDRYDKLKKHFSAEELKSRFLTEEDDHIREVDIAERVFTKHGDRTISQDELAREAAWILNHLFSRSYQKDAAKTISPEKLSQVQPLIMFILRSIYIDKFDIPYIAKYLKENWVDLINQDELWTIWELDEKWAKLQAKKQVVKSLYDSSSASIPDLYKDILREASSVEEVKDLSLHFQLHYQDEEATEGLKRPIKRDLYTIAKKSQDIVELAKQIAISSYEYAHNLKSGITLHSVNDPDLDPETFAQNNITRQFNTPSSLLKAIKHIHAYEISREPHVRSVLRECYERNATISTNPTTKGQTAGIFRGSVLRNLRNVSLQSFAESDEKYLELMKVLRAKDDGLLNIEVNVSNEYLDLVLDPESHYHSDKLNEVAAAWNKIRTQIIDEVKTLLNQDLSEYVLDYHRKIGIRIIGKNCSEYLYKLLMSGPYESKFEGSDKQFDRNQEKIDTNFQYFAPKGISQLKNPPTITKHSVLACTPGKTKDEPIVFAFLDSNGNVQETVLWRFPPYVSKRARAPVGKSDTNPIPDNEKNDQQLKQEKMLLFNINKFKPDVLAIAASGKDCRTVFRIVDDVQEKLPEELRLRMQFVKDEVSTLFENSDLANSELKEIAPVIRRAISLGRYLNDPITEISRLVNYKDDILFLKMHPLQNMIRKSQLKNWIEQSFIRAVNEIGVDLNRIITHKHLQGPLQFISGLGPRKADQLLKHLIARGELHSREELKEVFGINVFNNCAGFLRIVSTKNIEDEEISFIPLDNTRIHPTDYNLARKICIDALDFEGDDEDDEVFYENLRKLMSMYNEKGEWIGEDQDKLEELDLELYAKNLDEFGYGKKLVILKDIKDELKCPFKNPRRKYIPMNEKEIFYSSLNETEEHFTEGNLVYLNISDVTNSKVFGYLDNGLKAFIIASNLPKQSKYLNQDYSIDQSIEAIVKKIDFTNYLIELSAKESDLKKYSQNDSNEFKTQKDKKQKRFIKRNIDHPLFKNFNNEESLEYFKDKPVGECIIRPSSKGTSTLALSYKWYGGSIVNIEIREKKKISPLSLGEELWVKNQKFTDLDELHYYVVQLVLEKAAQISMHEKFKDYSRNQIYESLLREKSKNPAINPYCIGFHEKFPGKFFIFYIPGKSSVLYEPFTVTANGYHFLDQVFSSPTQLINHFKKHFKDLPSFKKKQSANH